MTIGTWVHWIMFTGMMTIYIQLNHKWEHVDAFVEISSEILPAYCLYFSHEFRDHVTSSYGLTSNQPHGNVLFVPFGVPRERLQTTSLLFTTRRDSKPLRSQRRRVSLVEAPSNQYQAPPRISNPRADHKTGRQPENCLTGLSSPCWFSCCLTCS